MSINATVNTRLEDPCNVKEDGQHHYNFKLHVISVFILLAVSIISASISVISTKVKALHIDPVIINVGKFFGSGFVFKNTVNQSFQYCIAFFRIVLATGFIHMLPGAMSALNDQCLPEKWTQYSAYAGLFTMAAALAMHLIEYVAHERFRSMMRQKFPKQFTETISSGDEQDTIENGMASNHPSLNTEPYQNDDHGHQHGVIFQNNAQQHKISTYLLEFGIALHSVLIGITLGVTSESFIPLLIALSFHQFFEGVALGAQIARVDRMSLRSALSMVLFFAVTTPIGIVIGIGIQMRTYNPKSVAALLVNGILDSVSAGILIYVALVNLIAVEMGPSATSFHALKTRLKLVYFLALYSGAGAMALLGLWA